MLQANSLLREPENSTPFEDYSIYMYRQSAPQFNDRVKELERKLLYPVSKLMECGMKTNDSVFYLIERCVTKMLFCINNTAEISSM